MLTVASSAATARNAVGRARHHAGERKRGGQTKDDVRRRQTSALPHDHVATARRACTERDADADFVRALLH